MRIGVLSHTYVEPENRKKLEALAARSLELTLYVPSRWSEGALGKTWNPGESGGQSWVRVVTLPVRRFAVSPAAAWWNLGGLRKDLRDGALELLHVEEEPWSFAARECAVLARRARIPTSIFTWQNLPNHPIAPLRAMARGTLRRYSGWVAGNEAAAALLRRIDENHPLIVLPQLGVELQACAEPRPEMEPPLRVGFAGRLVKEKGVADLLDALAIAKADWELTVVGDGPERAALEQRAKNLRISDRIEFTGSVPHDQVARIWPDLDVLVLPSRTTPRWAEQFGHVLLEAMANSVVVVGSDSGAIPEVIGDGGVVFPEGDVEALSGAIEQLGNDAGRLVQLRTAASRRAADFSNERIAGRLIEFWAGIRSKEGS